MVFQMYVFARLGGAKRHPAFVKFRNCDNTDLRIFQHDRPMHTPSRELVPSCEIGCIGAALVNDGHKSWAVIAVYVAIHELGGRGGQAFACGICSHYRYANRAHASS